MANTHHGHVIYMYSTCIYIGACIRTCTCMYESHVHVHVQVHTALYTCNVSCARHLFEPLFVHF